LVASEGFTPSELIGKDIDSITQSAVHDRFRLGVVIYYLLFGGPPFRGSWQGSGDPPEQVELIRRGYWPYALNSLIQPSNNTIPLDIIHPELQRSFLLCFNDGHKNPSARLTAREWVKNLELAFSQLKSCKKIDSHFYDSKYGHCYWCDRSDSLGIDIFLIGNIQPITPPSVPIPQPIPPSLSPPINNTSRRKILASLGSLGIGGAIYWFGIKPATSSSSPVSQPSPSQTPISKSTSQRASDYMETLPEGIKLEMIAIPAGEFLMGSPESAYDAYKDEKPQHKVKLSHFFMGKYPVTQEQYQAVMGSNPSKFKDNPKNPVDYVSWDDAQSFCQKLSEKTGNIYRLPSEAEWEYACRAGSQTRYYFGDDEDQLGEYAWYSDWQPHPVGLKKPNNWGLYDMHGTVWEWCEDIKHDNYRKAPTDGRAWIDKDKDSLNNRRVRRGGSWAFKSWYCRSARRGWNLEDFRYKDYGFRLALSAF
jgi:formylglycine-generating enzyme required for sulfatase activity